MADRIKIGDNVIVDSDRNLTVDRIYVKGDATFITGADPQITGNYNNITLSSTDADNLDPANTEAIVVITPYGGYSTGPFIGDTDAYVLGGQTNHPINTFADAKDVIDKFPFAISSGSSTDVGEMPEARAHAGTAQSQSHLYFFGGSRNVDPDPLTKEAPIHKFPFASTAPVTITTIPVDVHGIEVWENVPTQVNYTAVNCSPENYYYSQTHQPGFPGDPTDPGSANTTLDHFVTRFPFASDATVALAADIRTAEGTYFEMGRYDNGNMFGISQQAWSAPDFGLIRTSIPSGLIPPIGISVVYKFPFANDTNIAVIDSYQPTFPSTDTLAGLSPEGAISASSNGYSWNAFSDNYFRFPFSTLVLTSDAHELTPADPENPSLPVIRGLGAAHVNGKDTHGFTIGGARDGSADAKNTISRFPFSLPGTTGVADVGETTALNYFAAAGVD